MKCLAAIIMAILASTAFAQADQGVAPYTPPAEIVIVLRNDAGEQQECKATPASSAGGFLLFGLIGAAMSESQNQKEAAEKAEKCAVELETKGYKRVSPSASSEAAKG